MQYIVINTVFLNIYGFTLHIFIENNIISNLTSSKPNQNVEIKGSVLRNQRSTIHD